MAQLVKSLPYKLKVLCLIPGIHAQRPGMVSCVCNLNSGATKTSGSQSSLASQTSLIKEFKANERSCLKTQCFLWPPHAHMCMHSGNHACTCMETVHRTCFRKAIKRSSLAQCDSGCIFILKMPSSISATEKGISFNERHG